MQLVFQFKMYFKTYGTKIEVLITLYCHQNHILMFSICKNKTNAIHTCTVQGFPSCNEMVLTMTSLLPIKEAMLLPVKQDDIWG